MNVQHYILIKKQNENIGLFKKTIPMPCLPPAGTSIIFGAGFRKVACTAGNFSFSEDEGGFSLHHTIDISERAETVKDYISDDHYPILLVNDCGFEACWLEEAYENIIAKLELKNS
ncbi:hypothetical protein [Shewanella chilikensis]|uniref:hypothetical protein n=1 Tax=Shewanella chilikensis TaxID=558541 RepID=UPI003A986BB0